MQFRTRGNNLADKEAKSAALMKVSTPRIKEGEVQEYPPHPSPKEIEGYEKIEGWLEGGPYLNMGPITKATVVVIQFALWVDKNGTFCEEMTVGEVFSLPFNQFFVPTPPAFEGFQFPLDTNQVLLIILAYLAFRKKVRLTWITAQTAAPETGNIVMGPDTAPEIRHAATGPDTAPQNRDAGPAPDPAPQPTSEMNHPEWVGVPVKEVGKILKEHISPEVASLAPAGGKPTPCPEEEESDGAAAEPTDVTTVQVPAEPQRQSQPAAVAPVETKKYKTKSEHPGNKDKKGEKIIQILLESGFAIKKSKVKGPAQEIQFLAVKWQDGGRQIPTEVINKITAMSPPTNKKETQAFLGAIGFWRMQIPEYSQIVSPLYLVTCKNNSFHWGPEQQQAFAQIKQEIAHAVALGSVRMGPEVKNMLYSAAGNNGLSWSLW
ncbi:hypothetical protein DUI87_03051 [Hirundo rustica rustica]|uniref:Reverse transcriptase/retrotransposon-derived protein RNase H-like domain-containing protein n=1 Tax=Hirundo rustica rustica TaxID=333673 RepID=A0A3M0L9W1_HIRRU|nr:hypothetical protein DUI87_03051 [Hirundo rustica rustica]